MSGVTLAGHEWWLASRAAGVVALVLVSLSVGLGLASAARIVPPRLRRTVIALHEQIALAGLVSIAAHGLLLLPDRWLHPGLGGIALPFAIAYRPAATALGVFAGYLAGVLALSFYARRRIGPRLWRRLHTATLVAYAMSVAHTLLAGTDAGTLWLKVLLIVTAAPIVGLLAARLAPRRGYQRLLRLRPEL